MEPGARVRFSSSAVAGFRDAVWVSSSGPLSCAARAEPPRASANWSERLSTADLASGRLSAGA